MIILPPISPYIFSIDINNKSYGPTWYGLMYVISFIVGYLWARGTNKKRYNWHNKQLDDLLTYAIFGVVLGGRIGYVVFYQFTHFINNPLYLFKINEGGMSFHGGLLGVMAALWLFARKNNKHLLEVSDFIAPVVPIGLFFGRLGNFINGELWGKVTDLPWGVVFPTIGDSLPHHPSQIYEAISEGLILFVIVNCYARKRPALGKTSGLFLLGYAIFRFAVEFVRMPDDFIGYTAFGWLTRGQELSIPMAILGLYLLLGKNKKVN